MRIIYSTCIQCTTVSSVKNELHHCQRNACIGGLSGQNASTVYKKYINMQHHCRIEKNLVEIVLF